MIGVGVSHNWQFMAGISFSAPKISNPKPALIFKGVYISTVHRYLCAENVHMKFFPADDLYS